MTIPVLVLLAFAGWTIVVLLGSVGVYRWSRILTGQASIAEWRPDIPQGCDWYQRALRAHMNCIENLPVYSAIVIALVASGVRDRVVDHLALTMMAARIGQTVVHIAFSPTTATVGLRFALFILQIGCMTVTGAIVILVGMGNHG